MSKLGPISHFLSPVSCDSIVFQGLGCKWGAGVFNFVLSLSLSHTGHCKFNMAPHGKELSEDLKKIIVALHKDGVGYKKIAKTLKLSCSTVAKIIQRFNRTGSTQNRPRHGRPRGCVWEIDVWVLPALLQRLKGWGVSMSVLRPYATHCIKLVSMAVIPEGRLFGNTLFWWSLLSILLTISNFTPTCQQTLIRVLVGCLIDIC